ncbi:hypothetical protein BSLG_009890 [Batrachochytrium salamandrivorans]|nr:hypothetical protein BSLG_009890 [Batrachochytrium salamandrivorans]
MLSQILLRRLIVASPVRTLSIRAAAAPKLPNLQTVSWTEFFALRKSRRLVERSSGLVGGLLGLTLGSYYFVFVAEFDPFTPIWEWTSMPYMMAAMSVSVAATVAANLGSTQPWRAMRSP